MSKPKPGEWWQYGTDRRYIVGYTTDGKAVLQKPDGQTHLACGEYIQKTWKHLPDCTGWDWVPETFPQWWKRKSMDQGCRATFAYFVRTNINTWHGVYRDGTRSNDPVPAPQIEDLVRMTEAEALALLNPKPQPAEDPEEWVVQDQVPARGGIDQERYVGKDGAIKTPWGSSVGGQYRNNDSAGTYYRVQLRCRRKDLPKPAPAKRTVTVPKWLVVYSDGKVGVYETDSKPRVDSVHKEVHRVGETTYEIPE